MVAASFGPHLGKEPRLPDGGLGDGAVLLVLAHDHKFDIPLLELALRTPEFAYVGAMGSRRTHAQRMQALIERGIPAEQLARVASPLRPSGPSGQKPHPAHDQDSRRLRRRLPAAGAPSPARIGLPARTAGRS
ncbi:hypothetical protein GCM10018966_027140 [Streptomyces yanii]